MHLTCAEGTCAERCCSSLFPFSSRKRSLKEAACLQAYDECYHRLCDDIHNIHAPPLLHNTMALAAALGVLLPLEDLPGWLHGGGGGGVAAAGGLS